MSDHIVSHHAYRTQFRRDKNPLSYEWVFLVYFTVRVLSNIVNLLFQKPLTLLKLRKKERNPLKNINYN